MSKLDRFKRRGGRDGRTETDAEHVLWENLYRIPLEGTHFRRQVEIGPYRADFGSLRLKLLIDGPIHQEPEQKVQDLRRDRWLESEGYRVIRFSNHDVTTAMNSVLGAIGLAIEKQKHAWTTPHPGADPPTLPLKGRWPGGGQTLPASATLCACPACR